MGRETNYYLKEVLLNPEGTEYLRFYDGWENISKVPKRRINLAVSDGFSEVVFGFQGHFDTEEYEDKLVTIRDEINKFISHLNICKEEVEKFNINLSCLYKTFPGYVFWDHVLEIYGYNPELNQFMVIDDGLYLSEGGEWLVSIYKIIDNPTQKNFKDYRIDCGECLYQDYIKLIYESHR